MDVAWQASEKWLLAGFGTPPSVSDAIQWKDELAILRGPKWAQIMNKPSQLGPEEQQVRSGFSQMEDLKDPVLNRFWWNSLSFGFHKLYLHKHGCACALYFLLPNKGRRTVMGRITQGYTEHSERCHELPERSLCHLGCLLKWGESTEQCKPDQWLPWILHQLPYTSSPGAGGRLR